VSDPQPPAWTPETDPNRPYGAPPPPPRTAPLPQYATRPPQYATRPPQYGELAQYTQPPQHGAPPPPHQPPAKRKTLWLLAGAVTLVLALVAGTVVVLTTRGSGDAAVGGPMPTATYPDGVTSSETPSPTAPPSYTPEPALTPTPTPDRRRTLRDIDQGIQVSDDVYVNPVSGWRKDRRTKYSVDVASPTKHGVVIVLVNPIGYPATTAVRSDTRQLVETDRLTAVRMNSVKSLSPANANIAGQARMDFSGRYANNGAVISIVGRCTTMTGVESIHNVTVTVCVEALKDAWDVVLTDANRMLASVARSI
jgi:hypothetical protein